LVGCLFACCVFVRLFGCSFGLLVLSGVVRPSLQPSWTL
jgi:hypothetical protein